MRTLNENGEIFMQTSLKDIKTVTKRLLRAVPIKVDPMYEFIVQHPFTNSPYTAGFSREILDIRTEDGYKKWIAVMDQIIDESDLSRIFVRLNNAWNLTWLNLIKPYLSISDFSELLHEAWVLEENPNMDINVSTEVAIEWFKEADKKILMSEEEYAYWKALPDEVILYRGVANGRKKYGISWTDNKGKAIWFQNRWADEDNPGRLLRVKTAKEHCLCYLNSRNEKEVVLDVNAVKNDIEDITV
jgi:hypothetical protein